MGQSQDRYLFALELEPINDGERLIASIQSDSKKKKLQGNLPLVDVVVFALERLIVACGRLRLVCFSYSLISEGVRCSLQTRD